MLSAETTRQFHSPAEIVPLGLELSLPAKTLSNFISRWVLCRAIAGEMMALPRAFAGSQARRSACLRALSLDFR